jgi:hypothetical protein
MYRIIAMCLTGGALFIGNQALAQQKQHVSFKALAENSKITQQQNIEIGDVPNHVVRIFETHRTYPNDPPLINGLSIVEEWDRGTADYIDGNGPVTVQYTVYVMENGGRFFARLAEVVEGHRPEMLPLHMLGISLAARGGWSEFKALCEGHPI